MKSKQNGEQRIHLERFLMASAYHEAGFCLIPIRLDGSKAPALEKGHPVLLRKRRPSEKELLSWFRDEGLGIASLCGHMAGNLECLDFEDQTSAQEWGTIVGGEIPGLADLVCWVQT